MNWAAVAAFCGLCSILATVVGVAYTSGKLTQRINQNESAISSYRTESNARFEKHDAEFVNVAENISQHAVQLAKLEQWKDGFNAAARISGNVELNKD